MLSIAMENIHIKVLDIGIKRLVTEICQIEGKLLFLAALKFKTWLFSLLHVLRSCERSLILDATFYVKVSWSWIKIKIPHLVSFLMQLVFVLWLFHQKKYPNPNKGKQVCEDIGDCVSFGFYQKVYLFTSKYISISDECQ